MTTATTTPRLAYTADGSTVSYTFNFEIADDSSIAVYEGSTLKTLTTHYTVSFTSGSKGTGSVVFVSAPSAATVITFVRDTNLARTTDFAESGAFLASTVNNELDRLSQAVIDATDKIENRAISTTEPNTDTATMTIPVAATRANRILSFDSSGNATTSSAGTGSVTSVGLTTAGSDITITSTPVTTSGNINIEISSLTTDGLTVADADIKGTRSNENINITPSGSGKIVLDGLSWPSADGTANYVLKTDGSGTLGWVSNAASGTIFAGDDSSTTTISSGNTLRIAGGTNISTAVSGDTLTITGAGTATSLTTDGLTIADADILGTSSNQDINITPSGTGSVVISKATISSGTVTGITDITVADGGTGASSLTDGGILLGSGTNAITAMSVLTDSQMIVGNGSTDPVAESGATLRTSIGVGTGDSPTFTGLTVTGGALQTTGDASDIKTDTLTIGSGDATITGRRSNEDITIAPAGTGRILLQPGTTVQLTTGSLSVNAGYLENDQIRIDDNKISTMLSNADLILDAAGTGTIALTSNTTTTGTLVVGSTLQVGGNIALGGFKVTGGSTAAPSGDGDLSNKKYVDDSVSGVDPTAITSGTTNVTASSTKVIGTVSGAAQFEVTNGLFRIHNDLTVDGTTTTLNTTNLSVEDPIIELSRNNSGPADIDSGIMVNRGAANNAAIYWNEGDDVFKAVTTTSAGNATAITDTAFADFQVKDLTAASLALTTDLSVANGGTGASTFTDGGVLLGSGTGAITAMAVLTDSQMIVGNGSTDPVAESGATLRTSIGVGTGDSPTFTGLTISGGALVTTGDASDISTDTISIDSGSATISGIRSNEDLGIQANSTGKTILGGTASDFNSFSTSSRWTGSSNTFYQDLDHTIPNDRRYVNNMIMNIKLADGQRTSSSNDRWRQMALTQFDLNGSSTTATTANLSRGPLGLSIETDVENSSSGDSEIGNTTGVQGGVYVYTTSTGDINYNASDSSSTNVGVAAYSSWVDLEPASGATISIPNVYHFFSTGTSAYGSGTEAVTNSYHFYARANSGAHAITNDYAFYAENLDSMSAIGKLISYREKISTLTSSSTITVDCSLSTIFTVTLATNTEFNITNLGTGQSVLIKVIQDGTGSRTATWGTSGSTAVLFPGNAHTLSTGAADIDCISILNDGVNYIGNMAKDYS